MDGYYKNWNEGLEKLPIPKDDEGYTVSAALALLFESGRNILEFYKLRHDLGMGVGNAQSLLKQMHEIVENEIKNSEAMIPICETDKRLGYHSEAEGFKLFPKKLNARIEQLRELFQPNFPKSK